MTSEEYERRTRIQMIQYVWYYASGVKIEYEKAAAILDRYEYDVAASMFSPPAK